MLCKGKRKIKKFLAVSIMFRFVATVQLNNVRAALKTNILFLLANGTLRNSMGGN